eukprot:8479733-Pyramimonas_sp.AAC.1
MRTVLQSAPAREADVLVPRDLGHPQASASHAGRGPDGGGATDAGARARNDRGCQKIWSAIGSGGAGLLRSVVERRRQQGGRRGRE